MAWPGIFHLQSFLTPMPLPGFEPTSVSAVAAPGWDLSDALPTELHGRGVLVQVISETTALREMHCLIQALNVCLFNKTLFNPQKQ